MQLTFLYEFALVIVKHSKRHNHRMNKEYNSNENASFAKSTSKLKYLNENSKKICNISKIFCILYFSLTSVIDAINLNARNKIKKR